MTLAKAITIIIVASLIAVIAAIYILRPPIFKCEPKLIQMNADNSVNVICSEDLHDSKKD